MSEETILGNEDNVKDTDSVKPEDNVSSDDKVLLADDKPKDKEDDKTLLEDGDVKAKDGNADIPEGAPDEYTDFTVPDTMELDQTLLEKAKPLFKELGLTQEAAQKLIDFQTSYVLKETEVQAETWKSTMDEWSDAAKNDSEFGGKAFDENLATAKEAVNAFGNDKFNEMLAITGVGNHPEMVRFLFNIGKTMKEHDILQAGGVEKKAPNTAAMLYPTMNTG